MPAGNRFRDRLQEIRANRGLTQRDVADKLNISHVAYGNVERWRLPTLQWLAVFCRIMVWSTEEYEELRSLLLAARHEQFLARESHGRAGEGPRAV